VKVLVTGSEGSLMQATIPHLLADGHEVVGVDNFARYGKVDRPRDYEFVEGDLTDPNVVGELVQQVEGIIQGAATLYGVGGFHKHPATILANDLSLHANLLRAAVRHGVRRVAYISSSMVYERVDRTPTSEADAESHGIPLTDYGLSKLVGERMSKAFWQEFGLEYVIWRPFNIITPRERGEREPGISHVFADFVEALVVRRENPLRILGDGEQVRCFTWIDDVAAAIARYSFDDRTRNEVFNLGNPHPVTMKELARLVFERAQKAGGFRADETLAFESLPAYENDVRRRIPDVSKALAVLGWRFNVDLDEALDRCVAQALTSAGR
jgi:nucleoside-diphosphate-sugar epimerase